MTRGVYTDRDASVPLWVTCFIGFWTQDYLNLMKQLPSENLGKGEKKQYKVCLKSIKIFTS